MNHRYAKHFLSPVLFFFPGTASVIAQETGKKVTIVTPVSAHARITFGVEKLKQTLAKAGYQTMLGKGVPLKDNQQIVIGLWNKKNIDCCLSNTK
ncbi:iron-containing alcohol dehydrogenase [Larkinella sp. C7]|jgi:hypothetical protein|uniref:iron-containing alcohol dehydrogenase n=1 Tax=Larkinella sp. C7 TaxID=2576607 RepID=UPI001111091A|nr:iron-containing alcohol dehydrogenase [Larkinella sp. C7]